MGVSAIADQVTIPIDDVLLEGELEIPSEARGVVVFAHGSGSSRKSPRNQFVARHLRERGLGTLLFDLLTAAEERADRVTAHLRFDIGLLAERLSEAAAWLHRQHPKYKIGFFGSSTGGGAALVAAAHAEVQIDAIVSRGGRPDLAGAALPSVKSPTSLLVGALDLPVIDLNKTAYAQMTCQREMQLVPGASHLFEEPGTLEQVTKLAADWFIRFLHR